MQQVEKEQADSEVQLQYRDEFEAEWGANILTQQDLDYIDIMNQLTDIRVYLARGDDYGSIKIRNICDNIEEYINTYAYPNDVWTRLRRRDALDD